VTAELHTKPVQQLFLSFTFFFGLPGLYNNHFRGLSAGLVYDIIYRPTLFILFFFSFSLCVHFYSPGLSWIPVLSLKGKCINSLFLCTIYKQKEFFLHTLGLTPMVTEWKDKKPMIFRTLIVKKRKENFRGNIFFFSVLSSLVPVVALVGFPGRGSWTLDCVYHLV
jgi:hypothetical protein